MYSVCHANSHRLRDHSSHCSYHRARAQMHLPEFTDLAELDAKAPAVFERGLGWAQVQCVDLDFKASYGVLLYMGRLGHVSLKWPNFT